MNPPAGSSSFCPRGCRDCVPGVTLTQMNKEASELMSEAMKITKLNGSFSPMEIGARIGLNKPQSEAAARALSNAGILVLGFDSAAQFTTDFRKSQARPVKKLARRK